MSNAHYKNLYFEKKEWGELTSDYLHRENRVLVRLRRWNHDGGISDTILELREWVGGVRTPTKYQVLTSGSDAEKIRYAIAAFEEMLERHPNKDLLK